jgi:hypothetical protein
LLILPPGTDRRILKETWKVSVVQAGNGRFQAVETHTIGALGHDDAAVTKQIPDLAERNTMFEEPRCVLASEIVEANR